MSPHLSIDQALVQHYLLEVDTPEFERVRNAVARGGDQQRGEEMKVGGWHMFAWLDRPAIWAVRSVEVTSGLDTFLLEEEGLEGVRDVSELITCVIGENGEDDPISNSWTAFSENLNGPGVLFTTFLWLNWEALSRTEAWGGAETPSHSQVFAAIRRSLGRALAQSQKQGLFAGKASFLLCATTGDCDLILHGYVQSSRDLDVCLYLLTQMGCDVLASSIFGQERTQTARPWPVLRSTRTELAIHLGEYLKILKAVEEARTTDATAREFIARCFEGSIYPEIGLTRGHGPIPQMENSLGQVAGDLWQDRAVFGQDDFVVASREARTFGETVELLTRLDVAAGRNSAFPRRSSIRLGIGSLAHAHDAGPPSRQQLFGEPLAATIQEFARPTDAGGPDRPSIQPIKRFVLQLRAIGWREDLRIIERMSERCITLLRSSDTRRETRRVLQAALNRLSAMCQRLEAMENAPLGRRPEDGGDEAPPKAKARIARDIRFLRGELLQSGMGLDRVLSHHSKGTLSLLLHRAPQARGPEHIGSETALSAGLGILFHAPARRLRNLIRAGSALRGDAGEWRRELEAKLDEVATPIIYASQEPDFHIRPEMTLLRVPRWALWHPAAASHLIHELGHALAVIGSLAFLMSSVLRRAYLGKEDFHRAAFFCPVFEEALAAQGMPETRELLETHSPEIVRWISQFIEADGTPEYEANPARLKNLEEIMCDVVARLFSYGDAAPGDQRQLWDCFDYLAPFTARNEPEAALSLLSRLLASYIVVRQLREIRRERLQPWTRDAQTRLRRATATATENFLEHLRAWAADFAQRPEHRQLPRSSYDTIVGLPESFAMSINQSITISFQLSGHFIALVLSLPAMRESVHQSLFKSTHLWGNLVDAAWGAPGDDPDIPAIIASLKQGRVPVVGCRFPERLPRAVAWEYRQEARHEVPAHVRRALSFYLADLSQF